MSESNVSGKWGREETTVERVYEQVKAMAISFEFPPGARVNELAVAKQIGVSRTPLREALNRLTADGFLTFSSQRGFFRKALSVKAVEDLYEWREQLELGVVRLALERATEAALDEIEAFLKSSAPVGQNSKELLAFDEAFHQRVAALTSNAEIMDSLRSLNDRIRFMRWVEMERRGDYRLDDLYAILGAIRRKDLPLAEKLMSAHVLLPHDQIVAAVKDAFARIYMERESTFIPPV